MYVATMHTPHFSFVALGRTKAQAGEAMASAFDAHLQAYGASDRQYCMQAAGYGDGGGNWADSEVDGDKLGDSFGSTLAVWAQWLHEYYGIDIHRLKAGEGANSDSAEGYC